MTRKRDQKEHVMKTNPLDDLSTALEGVVTKLRGGATAGSTKKQMSPDEFVAYAVRQIQAAAKDTPAVAKRRLVALKGNVDRVHAAIAKMAAEDTDSEKIKVEVETAFAPTRAQGDTPMPELTTASDQSSTEVDVTSVTAPAGDSTFAENLKAVAKALEALKAGLSSESGGARRTTRKADRASDRGGARRGDGEGGGGEGGELEDDAATAAGEDGWPLDLNNAAFLKGDDRDEAALTWGADPAGLAGPKRR